MFMNSNLQVQYTDTIPANRVGCPSLRRSMEALLRCRGLVPLPQNNDLMALLEWYEVPESDYCAIDVEFGGRKVSLICMPDQAWARTETKTLVEGVKSMADQLGLTLLMLPEAFIRVPRGRSGTRAPASKMDVVISVGDRMSILAHLVEHGSASLARLAGLIHHSDPVAAVLQLASSGAIDVDLEATITAHSQVRMLGATP